MSAIRSGYLVYVGTYTSALPHVKGKGEGIYLLRMDPATGALTPMGVMTGVHNPSYLALDPSRRFLYAVNEVSGQEGEPSGAVSAFAIERQSGELRALNRQASQGTSPCYVSVDRTGRWVLVANYGSGRSSPFPESGARAPSGRSSPFPESGARAPSGRSSPFPEPGARAPSGSIAVLPIGADGLLGPAAAIVQHEGSSTNPHRQAEPHAHSIIVDPSNRYALAADLGANKVFVYRLDAERGTLAPHDPPWVAAAPGAGPRHLAFHPNGRYLYVTNELDSTVAVLAYDEARGALRPLQTAPMLPPGYSGESTAADLQLHPSGRFLYASNRGHDSVAIYAVDEATGQLAPLGHELTQGQTPRNLAIDPAGRFLFAANQRSDTIVAFWIDQETGALAPTGQVTVIPTPVCVRIVS